MSKTNLKTVIAVARAHNELFSAIEKSLQEYNLNTSEFGVLELLLHKGDQQVQKVAEKILVTSGTITYVIDKLQKKELVAREKCKKDRRVYYVALTEKGRELITEIFEKHETFLDNLFIEMSDKDKNELINGLIHLQNSITNYQKCNSQE